jgi:hypothetical protein
MRFDVEDGMDSRFEIIDAFVDGERVDAAALKLSLSEPAGRDYLVDVWLLREGVQEQMAAEPAAPSAMPRTPRARAWLMAAALVISVAGGYVVGYRVSGSLAQSKPAAPAPNVTVTPTPTQAPGSFPAPVPTRVIQVQFGTDAPTSGGGE